jgi:hypothetical protein
VNVGKKAFGKRRLCLPNVEKNQKIKLSENTLNFTETKLQKELKRIKKPCFF